MVLDSPFETLLHGHVDEASEMRLDERCKFCFAHQIDPYDLYGPSIYGPLWSFQIVSFLNSKYSGMISMISKSSNLSSSGRARLAVVYHHLEDLGGAVGTAFSRETDAVNAIDSA